jgi:two-component system chemotaxis sensor kinase CheA
MMSEQQLDPFAVDMELLRRVSVIRSALEVSGGVGMPGSPAVLDAVRSARAHAARTGTPVAPLLEALERRLEGAPAEPGTERVGSAAWVDRALRAADEVVLTPADPAALRELEDVLAALWAPSPLDSAAAYLVEMDPESLEDARELGARLELASAASSEPVAERLRAAVEALAPALRPRARKASRSGAVARVSELVEEAVVLLEAAESGRSDEAPGAGNSVPRAGVGEETRAVPPAAPPQPLSSTMPPLRQPPASPSSSPLPAEAVPADTSASSAEIPLSDPFPANADAELMGDFVTESFEYLEQAEEALLALEANPGDPEAVNVVFRAFHTIKGVSGFLELRRISELSHHAESLLTRVRDGGLVYSGAVADLSLRSVDVLKALLDAVRGGLESGVIPIPTAYASLHRTLADPTLPDRLVDEAATGPGAGAASRDADEGADGERSPSAGAENSIRIRTDRLDRLVDMVGELVIAHSMLAQDGAVLRDRGPLSRKVDHTAKILRELQDLSTSLRMVPLKPAFRKVSRVVRDLSKKSGKQVRLVTEGEDTEIDRSMVDVLADPLVHMVRNSVDHGLESAEERVAAGKPPEGTVRIAAYQAGGNVVIEVSDDGRGLDRDRIVAKARQRGIIESDRGMTDREIFGLIFAAGFSTAERVTEVSGRGVGMDVVRRNVESLRGRVVIESAPGQGSTFSIILPLTLAITDGMVIRVGEQRYIIPSVKILMSMRPEAAALSTVAGKGEMVLLHGELLPVVRLHRHWGVRGAVEDPTRGLLVIVGEGGRKAALLVDELVTQQQFVVKPLTGMVANTRGVAGGAVLGNGDVGLILDPDALVNLFLAGAGAAA